jgi:hypothetical protein
LLRFIFLFDVAPVLSIFRNCLVLFSYRGFLVNAQKLYPNLRSNSMRDNSMTFLNPLFARVLASQNFQFAEPWDLRPNEIID